MCQTIEQLPEQQLFEDFGGTDKYGNYLRNSNGLSIHTLANSIGKKVTEGRRS